MCHASILVQDPRANLERRTVSNVLVVTARHFCDPLGFAVLVIPDNHAIHELVAFWFDMPPISDLGAGRWLVSMLDGSNPIAAALIAQSDG